MKTRKSLRRVTAMNARGPSRGWIPACAGMTTLADLRISIFR